MHILLIAAVLFITIILLLSRKKELPAILTVGSLYEREITEGEFDLLVVEKSKTVPVLVDFYARWCPPCQFFTPLLAEIAEEYQGAFLLAKIDVDLNKNLVNKFGVSSYPTVALFKNGESVEAFSGGKLEHTIRYKLAQHGIQSPKSGA